MTSASAPVATYRLQLNKSFTFVEAAALVPYLKHLGVSDAYASPILQARAGSAHGYDITDHTKLNAEIGTEADFNAWCRDLAEHQMSLVVDTVPNHMAVVGNVNPWWNDVLENGPSSPYSAYFDIAWTAATRPELQGRVLIPILGEPYARVLEAQQLQLVFEGGAFTIHYFEHVFPVAPRSYGLILGHRLGELDQRLAEQPDALLEYHSIFTAVKHLPRRSETDPALVAERQREKEIIKRRLAALTQQCPQVQAFLEENLAIFNGVPGDPHSLNHLEALLDDQVYRLAFWRVAAEEINYRRFFDVNELAALSMERPDVFEATHAYLLQLAKTNCIRGFRIDHIDGLYDPREYLQRLDAAIRERVGRPLYTVVEKILAPDEKLPADWATAGTSGYDFLNLVNGLFVDTSNVANFTRLYADWIGDETSFEELSYQKKILILQIALSGEMQMLTHQLDRLAQRHRNSRDFTRNGLRIGLREIIACFPVYRSYIADSVSDEDRRYILRAVRRAASRNPTISTSLLNFIRDTLLLRPPGFGGAEADYAEEQRRFVGKFQQVTAPVMAKAAEDTVAYIFNRLLSLNEVGSDADRFGVPVDEFHKAMRERLETFPDALSATATHDTKRGEDVRARLNVLSEMPDAWKTSLYRWSRLNAQHRTMLEDRAVPDRNEECFIYQILLGAWCADCDFLPRMQAYFAKAFHEAKVHTSWINPNQAFDEAIQQFVARILDPQASKDFLADFLPFQRRLSEFGMLNALGQTLLKIAAPGVPDFYQGTEFWDLSLVDPDNRRPVDFAARQQALAAEVPLHELIEHREDGRIKLFLTQRALRVRAAHAPLFARGSYLPLEVAGPMNEHLMAFARVDAEQAVVVVVPRLLVSVTPQGSTPFEAKIWQGTSILLPDLPTQWSHALSDRAIQAQDGNLPVNALFDPLPIALLVSERRS